MKLTQNIYDDPEFFDAYSRLDRSIHGLDGAPEWPAMRAMLPPLRDRRIADLGCGFGWFCRWAHQQGAARILGLDVSDNMLARARETVPNVGIDYVKADLEHLKLPAQGFDLVYSSLALHYIVDLDGLLAAVHDALAAGGHLIFSVEHPIFTAPGRPGWVVDGEGRKTWPIDGYLQEGPRTTDWLAKGVIKQHRTMGRYLTLLTRHGFAISHVEEWEPDDAWFAARPEFAGERGQRPNFLLVAARRGCGA
jgi:SAM-dependent methyltransferase